MPVADDSRSTAWPLAYSPQLLEKRGQIQAVFSRRFRHGLERGHGAAHASHSVPEQNVHGLRTGIE
jgi:hypothetical protein